MLFLKKLDTWGNAKKFPRKLETRNSYPGAQELETLEKGNHCCNIFYSIPGIQYRIFVIITKGPSNIHMPSEFSAGVPT
jgi:hypothetical protein